MRPAPQRVTHKKKQKKRVVRHKPAAVKPKPRTTPATTTTIPTITAVKVAKPLGFAPTSNGNASGLGTLLILLSLAGAIACFSVASLPPALLPRRAAYYVLPRQSGLVVLGVGLFGIVVLAFFWTRAH